MKKFVLAGLLSLFPASVSADAISLSWNIMAGATSYKIYQSVDAGVTWTVAGEIPSPPVTVQVAGDRLVLFRVSAVNSVGETINHVKGAWYNGKWAIVPTQLRAE